MNEAPSLGMMKIMPFLFVWKDAGKGKNFFGRSDESLVFEPIVGRIGILARAADYSEHFAQDGALFSGAIQWFKRGIRL